MKRSMSLSLTSIAVGAFILVTNANSYVLPVVSPILSICHRHVDDRKSRFAKRIYRMSEKTSKGSLPNLGEGTFIETSTPKPETPSATTSKREMMKFAIPALGIYLANPLLSNIDNAFVGNTVGTQGLAALSPATICTDQMLYLFSFLSRATTGMVSRAYGSKTDGNQKMEAAAEAASAPLTVSLICGVFLSIFYALFTPNLLTMLKVTPALCSVAASYIYWRGAIAWAALAQGVTLSIMMATRDAITPLKIVALSAVVNIVGDFLLCCWPFRWGVSGAAAATAFATVFSTGFMIRGLRRKGVLPKIRSPTKNELLSLTEFTGPLLAITVTRLIGFVSMQRAAMTLGVKQTAAYQLCINLIIFFLLFAEPLSQLSQTQLPALIDEENGSEVRSNLKSVLLLGVFTALGIGSLAGLSAFFGASVFSSDLIVQGLAKDAALSVFVTVATAIFAVTVDGAMLASKDFGFMLTQGLLSMMMQLLLLKTWCSNLSDIFTTFTLRLGSYAVISLIRAASGYGKLGRALSSRNTRINGA
ncbi:MATE efflux family protein [Nitzschia inconspicua]|uniref:MATE efflux family protein n=1 Tax=Nitzschia inconspicua TaxID=303405 RepID=A0A9K3PFJ9_9STRA|nr:MATE efflux family protein [Nitzschia inconspicua]